MAVAQINLKFSCRGKIKAIRALNYFPAVGAVKSRANTLKDATHNDGVSETRALSVVISWERAFLE